MNPHYYEPLNALFAHIPPADVFVDVGPGVLNSEAWYVRGMWPDCQIIGFEPWPESFNEIVKHYPGCLMPFAVGHTHSFTQLGELLGSERNAGRYGGSEVIAHPAPMVQLNNALRGYQKLGYRMVLWADCEGSERDVLCGANFVDFEAMVLEVRDKSPDAAWPTSDVILPMLADRGYKIVAEFCHDADVNLRNIVAVKR